MLPTIFSSVEQVRHHTFMKPPLATIRKVPHKVARTVYGHLAVYKGPLTKLTVYARYDVVVYAEDAPRIPWLSHRVGSRAP